MPPKTSGKQVAPETLASASGKNIDGILNRVNKRRNTSAASPTPDLSSFLPPSRQRGTPANACGAPAVDKNSEHNSPDEDNEYAKNLNATEVAAGGEQTHYAHLGDGPSDAAIGASAGGSDDDGDWEDIESGDDTDNDILVGSNAKLKSKSNPASGGGITVDLDGPSITADGAGPSRRRQAFTKEDRETARLVHRSHLLCLLGRGLLYDAAAGDLLLQATINSLMPEEITTEIENISNGDRETHGKALIAIVEWFRQQFKLLKTSAAQPPAENEDEISAAIDRANGLAGITQQLLDAVEKGCGTAEELVSIFAACLRAVGCLVRTVRLLEPSSLKPGDALRQQENALKSFMKRPARQERPSRGKGSSRGKGVAGIAAAASDLLLRKESDRQAALKDQIAAQLGLADSRALKIVAGKHGAAPSIELDASKLKRTKKRAASGGAPSNEMNEGAAAAGGAPSGARGKKMRVAEGPGGSDTKKAGKKILKKDEAANVDPAPTKEPAAAAAGGGKKGRKRKADSKEELLNPSGDLKAYPEAADELTGDGIDDDVIDLTQPDTEPQHNTKDTDKDNISREKACEGGIPLDKVQEKPSGRKRKCDEELERELEIAIAATAFLPAAAGEENSDGNGNGGGVDNAGKGGGKGAAGRAGKSNLNGVVRGAAFGAHQSDVGQYWVEVYCGSMTSGRWVHVCPISGWVDRADDVEGLAPRGQSLAYVIAFGGKGGAKDVTRRYTSSFINAEKQREGEWWDATLRPLRSIEVAALHAATATATAVAGDEAGASAKDIQPHTSLANSALANGSSPPGALSKASIGGKGSIGYTSASAVPARGKSGRGGTTTATAPLLALREDKELEQRAAAERQGLPTTIEGFKTHATFILARHVGKHQALRPGSKTMGTHKGEAYYFREDVGDVHTAEKWRRLGREVLPEELGSPAKLLKKRKAPAAGGGRGSGGGGGGRGGFSGFNRGWAFGGQTGSGGGGRGSNFSLGTVGPSSVSNTGRYSAGGGAEVESLGDDDNDDDDNGGPGSSSEEMSKFYGIWQTREWAPPAASGGRVPKNERGNVEVPPLAAALPAGTVHIQLPMIGPICRKLQIDYAPALTGFDIRGGRSVPAIDGVVICIEHEAALRAAYEEEMAQKAQQAQHKRMAEAEKSWRELLRALLTRVRLARSYSGNGGGAGANQGTTTDGQPGTAEGEAAAMLAHDAAHGKKLQGAGDTTNRKGGRSGKGRGKGKDRKDSDVDGDGFGAEVKIEEI